MNNRTLLLGTLKHNKRHKTNTHYMLYRSTAATKHSLTRSVRRASFLPFTTALILISMIGFVPYGSSTAAAATLTSNRAAIQTIRLKPKPAKRPSISTVAAVAPKPVPAPVPVPPEIEPPAPTSVPAPAPATVAAPAPAIVSSAGVNYPWAGAPFDSTSVDSWGMYKRQCTSYAAWKVASSGRNMPNWGGRGNANQWDSNATADGISVDGTPRVGDVAVSHASSYGHVMYVEAVNGDGTIKVSQYNADYSQTYSEATKSVAGLTFIHF